MAQPHKISVNTIGWITTILLLITNIIIVARWTGMVDQRLTALENQTTRIETAIASHLQSSIK